MLEVSTKVPPAPTKASSCAAAVSRPHVMVPSPSRDTSSPLRPTRLISIRQTYDPERAARRRPAGSAGSVSATARSARMQLGLNFGYAPTAAEMTTNLELAVLAE